MLLYCAALSVCCCCVGYGIVLFWVVCSVIYVSACVCMILVVQCYIVLYCMVLYSTVSHMNMHCMGMWCGVVRWIVVCVALFGVGCIALHYSIIL